MKKEKLNTIYIKPPNSGDHCPFISIEISWPAHTSLLHNSDHDSRFLHPFPLPRPLLQMAIDSVLHNVSKSYPNRILIRRGIWAGSLKEAPICVPCSPRPSPLSPLPQVHISRRSQAVLQAISAPLSLYRCNCCRALGFKRRSEGSSLECAVSWIAPTSCCSRDR